MVNFLEPQPDVRLEVEVSEEQTDPVAVDPFNPTQLIVLFKRYHVEIDKMSNKAMGIEVVDDKSLELATTYTTQAKALFSAIDKKRIEKKAPYKKVTDVIDSETKGLKDRLLQIQKFVNDKIRPYLQKKEVERLAKQRKADEEARKVQEKLDKEAEAVGEVAPVVVAETVAETKVETSAGTAKLKESWAFTIEDIKAVPDAAFEDRGAEVIKALSPWVNAQVKAGVRSIPGVKIFKQAKIDTRASRSPMQF